MAKPTSQSTSADDRNLVTVDDTYIAPGFEDRVQMFWEKNSKLIVTGILVVAAIIIGRGVLNHLAEQRQLAIQAEFAAAADNATLNTFAAEHPDHTLAGVAHLRLADEAYAAGDYTAAVTAYDQALKPLEGTPAHGRARIGAAVARIQAGQTTDGEAALARIADDENVVGAARAQAAYHLAVIARSAENIEEAIRRADQASLLSANSIWSQQAMMLRFTLPTPAAAPAAAEATPEAAPATE